jgi:hypothetical protein
MMRAIAAGLILALSAAPVLAESVPRIDFMKVCRSTSGSPVNKDQLKTCLDSEGKVRDELAQNWGKYSAASRAQCTSGLQGAYHPSYIELISCLEMANPDMAKPRVIK